MTNPYESPKTPLEPNQPPRITGRTIGAFLGGAVVCAGITLVGALIAAIITGLLGTDPYAANSFEIFLNSPGVIGPVCGGILWAVRRRRNRPFAMGAVAFGVAAFLFVGGCLTLMKIG